MISWLNLYCWKKKPNRINNKNVGTTFEESCPKITEIPKLTSTISSKVTFVNTQIFLNLLIQVMYFYYLVISGACQFNVNSGLWIRHIENITKGSDSALLPY